MVSLAIANSYTSKYSTAVTTKGKKTKQCLFIVKILFPKETLRPRALEIIIVHKIEVSEGVSIFIEKRKINILLPHRIRMVRYPPKFNLLE